jgi:hypothetical protein
MAEDHRAHDDPPEEGGDPACWAHLFEDSPDEDPGEDPGEDHGTGGGTTEPGVDLPSH